MRCSRPPRAKAAKKRWTGVGCRPRKTPAACRQKRSGSEWKPCWLKMRVVSAFAHNPVPGDRKSGMPAEVEAPAPIRATTRRLRPDWSRWATPARLKSPCSTPRRSSSGIRWCPPRRDKYFRFEASLFLPKSTAAQPSSALPAAAMQISLINASETSPPACAAKCTGVQPPSSSARGSARAASSFLNAPCGTVLCIPACRHKVCKAVKSPKSLTTAAPCAAVRIAAMANSTRALSSGAFAQRSVKSCKG
mmetsp:Transcript_66124/g.166765  ORF Transcript_66124/g.166765 Transcript_66124/m.166765 type:complete len:249 (-) Transcript_66124:1039-1785(-)